MSDNLISLEDAIETIASADITDGTEPVFTGKQVIALLKDLPSVTQKSETVTEFAERCRECGARYGKLLKQKSEKWDRLYSWLNDMLLGIAPDETVDDIDERHCREAQTDILDEIMEWMIKAEGEAQE